MHTESPHHSPLGKNATAREEPVICIERAPNREELFRTALESLAEGILITDHLSRIIYVNGTLEEMTGYSRGEMIGHVSHRMLLPPEEWPKQEQRLTERLSGQREEYEHQIRRKDGALHWVRVRATPYMDVSGKVIGTMGALMCIETEKRLEATNAALLGEISGKAASIVGTSGALKKVLDQIHLVAPTGAAVLVLGESGVGKELVARAIHDFSERRDEALVRVNCASVPKELFESEFFGHVRGAFTGALRDRAGRFDLARGGTLFLDEIGEIPLELQSKLLRVLQEGTFERVGEERTRRADVRIVAATNRDLEQEVKAGRFRADLFYRLSVFPIQVPPLRERLEDIPVLAQHFTAQAAKRLGQKLPRLSDAHLRELARYDWPGNIRELQNVIERAVILSRTGPLRFDLPGMTARTPPALPSLQAAMAERPASLGELKNAERQLTITALRETQGRIYGPNGAAVRLGLPPTTLLSRLKKLGVTTAEFKGR